MTLTAKLFAHIQNDAHLIGTRVLEGSGFEMTIESLLTYVKACKEGEATGCTATIEDHIAPLLQKLKLLKQNAIALKTLNVSECTAAQISMRADYIECTQSFCKQIDALASSTPEGPESVLIPGGWQDKEGKGHAVVYEFNQEENGDLIFIIHNSGAGLEYHQRIQDGSKERFCPIKVYRIPKTQLKDEKLNWFIGELLKPTLKLSNEKEYTAQRLYHEVITKIAYLKGELIDAFQFTEQSKHTAGQRSGTCAEKSLHQMLEHALPNKKIYKQFIYGYKRYVLEQYIMQVEEDNDIDKPGVRNQISLAIENMARLLLKADYFDSDFKKAQVKYLLEQSKKLTRTYPAALLPYSVEYVNQGLNLLDSQSHDLKCLRILYPQAIEKPDLTINKDKKDPREEKISSNIVFNFKNNINVELEKFHKEIDILSKIDPVAAANSLAHFFLSYPIPSQAEESLDEILDKLGALNTLFVKIFNTLNGDQITPQFSVAQLSFITIIASLSALASKENERNINYFDIVRTAIFESLHSELKNPYFGAQDYLIDARLVQIREILTSNPIIAYQSSIKYYDAHEKNKYYYDNILKQNNVKEQLEGYYQTYCDKAYLTSGQKVCEKAEKDLRALFLMQHYLSQDDEGKKCFIEKLCLFYHYDEPVKLQLAENLQAAAKEFYRLNKLEIYLANAYLAISHRSADPAYTLFANPIIIKDRNYASDQILSPTIESLRSKLKIPKTVSWPEENLIKLILNTNSKDSNEIQIAEFVPSIHRKMKEIKWIRELLHLRTSALQLRISLEFFTQHLHLLQDSDKQIYLEKNLFQPPLLKQAFDEEPENIAKLYQFLALGKQSFSKNGKPELIAMFFMTLSIKVALYARDYYATKIMNEDIGQAETIEANKELERTNAFLQEKLEEINQLLVLESNLKIKQHLSFQRMLILSDKLIQTDAMDEKKILSEQLLSSLLTLRYGEDNHKEIENLHDKKSVENAFRILQLNLAAINQSDENNEYLIDIMAKSLSEINSNYKQKITEKQITWIVNSPYVILMEEEQELCTVDISNGRISSPGLDRGVLPDSVLNSHLYKQIIGKDAPSIVLTNQENTYFEFENKEENYRIIKNDEGKYFIQRQYSLLNQGNRWYQAQQISEINDLQTIFKEGNNIAWVSVKESTHKGAYSDQILIGNGSSHELYYCYQANSQELIKLDAHNNDTGLRVLSTTSFLHQLMSDFEDPQFVIGLQDTTGYQIELTRYNIKLRVTKSQAQDEWEITLEGTDYKLDLSQKTQIIPGLNSQLVFKSTDDQKILVPIQRFMIEADLQNKGTTKPVNEQRTEYYNFTQDIGDHLRQDYFANELNNANFIVQQYKNSEQYVEYTIENNKLSPHNMEGGLYLAYVYLCNQQPEKAFKMLQYCERHFGEISGSQNEIDYLQWIVCSTPTKLQKSTIEATIKTPEFLSVQLKALCFLASFKRDNPGFKPNVVDPKESSYNPYKRNLESDRAYFYATVEINIANRYHQYHHTHANVPAIYALSEHDKLLLLRSVYLAMGGQVIGPLGVAWRKLEASNLYAQLVALENIAKSYENDMPAQLTQDIEKVKQELQKEKSILTMRSKIANSPISLTIPQLVKWYYETLSVSNIKDLAFNVTQDIDVKALLKFPICEQAFIESFPSICDALYQDRLGEEHKNCLLEFSMQTINAYHLTSQENSKSNLPNLCTILYLFMENIDKIRKIPSENNKDKGYISWSQINDLDKWVMQITDMLSRISPTLTLDYFNSRVVNLNECTKESNRALVENSTYKSPIALPLKNVSIQEYSIESQLFVDHPHIVQFYQETERLDNEHAKEINIIVKQLKETEGIDNIHERMSKQAEIDDIAGYQHYLLEQNKLTLCVDLLGKSELREKIVNRSKVAIETLQKKCVTALDKIIIFANQKFDIDPTSATEIDFQLALIGRKRNRLKRKNLLHLYLCNDMAQTLDATGLGEEECKKLHDKITKYLALTIQKQQYERICRYCEDPLIKNLDCDVNTSLDAKDVIAKVGDSLYGKNCIDYQAFPALMLFQYDQEILIRSSQWVYIEALLKKDNTTLAYSNIIAQLIMGGGKSKVLLPLLALLKATGENLSIIEVPEALYKTNLADLNQISFRLFGQHAFGLHFDRQTPCDAISLKKLYKQLQYVSVNRGYVVTTRESMASLNLKYHELLSNPPEANRAQWEKQIKWFDRIINFRKNKGDVLVDEIDASLAIRKQINYTLGDRESIPALHLDGVVALYQFLNQVPLATGTFLDLVSKPEPVGSQTLLESLNILANALIHNPHSPLFPFLPNTLLDVEKEQLIQYLLNNSKMFPPCLKEITDPIGQFTYKHLKGQLSHLLPHTLSLKLYEDYGPSENPEKSMLHKTVTIPYSGNNEPEENSKDTNYLKTINLTIQNNLKNGIDPKIIASLFVDWVKDAKAQLLEDPTLGNIDNTQTGIAINAVLEKSGLQQCISKINLDDHIAMGGVYQKLKKNDEFIFFTLKEHILPLIEIDNKILTHNPINHVGMYRSYQGVTGTPSNWRTMHQNLHFDATLSLGTDGLTKARLKSKKTPVSILDYQNPIQFLSDALNKISAPETLRAVIDVGATFRGIKNPDVALEIAKFAIDYNKKYATSLKYILYFDKNESGQDELYAISIDDQAKPRISLKGKSAAEIEKLLHCTPNDCFTYYDQKHCRGADIKQANNAQAIVTVDQTTLKDDFYQGTMRMRDLGASQNIHVLVSNETKKVIAPDKTTLTIDDVDNFIDKNQTAVLLLDHFSAALEKMQNLIVEDFKTKIYQVDSKNIAEKERRQKIFEPFLIQSLSTQFIENYGAIEEHEDTINIFNRHAKNLLLDWAKFLHLANISFEENEYARMESSLEKLKTNELKNCDKQYLHSTQPAPEQTAQSKHEMRNSNQDQDQKQNQQLEVDELLYEAKYFAAGLSYWTDTITLEELLVLKPDSRFKTSYWDNSTNSQRMEFNTVSMPAFVKCPNEYSSSPLPISNFNKAIRRSHNFCHTTRFDDSKSMQLPCQKQIHTVLMIQTENELKAIILTYPEADHIKLLLSKSKPQPPNYIWLINTQNSLLSGERPPSEILHPSYENIMQQLQFYNGDLLTLCSKDLSGSWLMEGLQEKMQYFEDHFLPYRMTDKQKFNTLKSKMLILQKAYETIANTVLENVESIRWDQIYPSLNDKNIHSLKQFNTFCKELDKEDSAQVVDQDIQQYFCPYYFQLLQEFSHDSQFSRYIDLINNDSLKEILCEQFERVIINKNYDWILALLQRNAFANNAEKKAVFLQALGQAFRNCTFTEGLYTHASPQTLSTIMQLISVEDKTDLIQALSSRQITEIFAKDISTVKLFFDDIDRDNFNTQVAMLDLMRTPIEGSKYGESTYSFDYLLSNPEKFDYLRSHASEEYLFKLFSSDSDSAVFIYLFLKIINNPDAIEYSDKLNTLFDLLGSQLPVTLQNKLWQTAIESEQSNALMLLASKLPAGSFITAIKAKPDLFLQIIKDAKSTIIIDFFWNEFDQLSSDKVKLELINKELRERAGWCYVTLLEILKKKEEKPEAYYRLVSFQLKNELITAVKNNTPKAEDILKKYVEAMKVNPQFFIPLSELKFESEEGSEEQLNKVVTEKGSSDMIKMYNEYLTQEQTISKLFIPNFEREKSGLTADNLIPQLSVETKPNTPLVEMHSKTSLGIT